MTELLTEESVIWQMTTAISIEDVRREVKILKTLSGHKNLVKFHDAFEDAQNVYIVMEYVFCIILYSEVMEVVIHIFYLQSCLLVIIFMKSFFLIEYYKKPFY